MKPQKLELEIYCQIISLIEYLPYTDIKIICCQFLNTGSLADFIQ